MQGDYSGKWWWIVLEGMYKSVNVWVFTGNNYNNTVSAVGYMANQVKLAGKPVNERAKSNALDYPVDLYLCCRFTHRLSICKRGGLCVNLSVFVFWRK